MPSIYFFILIGWVTSCSNCCATFWESFYDRWCYVGRADMSASNCERPHGEKSKPLDKLGNDTCYGARNARVPIPGKRGERPEPFRRSDFKRTFVRSAVASWLMREVVDGVQDLDFITKSLAMQGCFTKMILLRYEIGNPVKGTRTNLFRSSYIRSSSTFWSQMKDNIDGRDL
jgi:hypothetical protein